MTPRRENQPGRMDDRLPLVLPTSTSRAPPAPAYALCPAVAERASTSRSATNQSSLSLPGTPPRSR